MQNLLLSETLVFPSHVLYGGDYNPEQWDKSVRSQDAPLMNAANWNIATLPVFGWATLEPSEGEYSFEWLDEVFDSLHNNGIQICLATATASTPAWLDQKYPDVLVTAENGQKRKHGNRHTFCPNSPNFRRLATTLVRKIAERYKNHPAIALWHISNEYGTYCYCEEHCAPAFRAWLRSRYGSLEELNRVWYTTFWGHTFTDWSQIDTPTNTGEGSMNALKLDYYRFQSDSLLNCFRAEKEVIRAITPKIPITTNLMGPFFPLNYREWAREMDIVSWDNYPGPNSPASEVAFCHAVMRGLKEGQPFLLMEQSPSQQNWQPYNAIKPPKQLRLQSFQAVAQGADSVMYFQWRRGRGGIEKLHGAIMEHHGRTDTRVFREAAELGGDLQKLGTATVGGRQEASVAILFDWENWWNLRLSSGPSVDLDYARHVRHAYVALHQLGIACEVVCPDADLSGFKLVIAPTLSLIRRDDGVRLQEFVRNGGALIATAFTGLVDDTDLVYENGAPGPLADVLGIWVEETDALPKGKTNRFRFMESFGALNAGHDEACSVLCERIRMTTATPIAVYTADFYAGEPAVTQNQYGSGTGYFVATCPDIDGFQAILGAICGNLGISSPLAGGAAPPDGVEVTVRQSPAGNQILYLLNHASEQRTVSLPSENQYIDLLSGESIRGEVQLNIRDVYVLQRTP